MTLLSRIPRALGFTCALALGCAGTDDDPETVATGGSAGSTAGGGAGVSGSAGSIETGGSAGVAGSGGIGGAAGAAGATLDAGTSGAAGSTAPTCAQAGGNRCTDVVSECSGLLTLDSSDCVACCEVPKNPVFAMGWADPFIARDGDTYYTFATGSTVRRRSSKNLVDWSPATDALTSAPWKKASFGFWAPAVYRAKSGKWILYYASEVLGASTKKCIGRAVADSITGKFVDDDQAPFICRTTHWSIDPSVFRDNDGKDYLLWRQDTADMPKGNAFIRRLDDNGNLTGVEHLLLSRAKSEPSWEFDASGGVLENPAMIHVGGVYHLFYSGFRWETASYANGHAICDTPLGPCTKTSKAQPWLGSQGNMLGPGGLDFVKAPDGTLFAYMHGWLAPDVGASGGRKLWLDRMQTSGTAASVAPL